MATQEIKFEFDKTDSRSTVDKITQYVNKWVDGQEITESDLENLIREVAIYVFDKHNWNLYGKEFPMLELSDEIASTTNGSYFVQANLIEFNKTAFMKKLNQTQGIGFAQQAFEDSELTGNDVDKWNAIADVINTVAHEIEHFFQYALKETEFDLTYEEQERIQQLTVDDTLFGGKIALLGQQSKDTEQREAISDFLDIAPYFANQWELVEENPNLVQIIRFAYYLSNFEEEDARQKAGIFTKDLASDIINNSNATEDTKIWGKSSIQKAEENPAYWADGTDNSVFYQTRDKLEDGIRGMDEFLAYAKDFEKARDKIHSDRELKIYSYAVKMFLSNRSLEEKVHIYKNALFHGLDSLAFNTWNEIEKTTASEDVRAIKEEIMGHLKSGSILSTKKKWFTSESEKLNENAYSICLHQIPSIQVAEIALELIRDEKTIYAMAIMKNNFHRESVQGAMDTISFYEVQQLLKKQIKEFFKHQEKRPIQERECFEFLSTKFELKEYFDSMEVKYPVPENKMGKPANARERESYLVKKYGIRQYIKNIRESGKPGAEEKIQKLMKVIKDETSTIVTEEKIEKLIITAEARKVQQEANKRRIEENNRKIRELNERHKKIQNTLTDRYSAENPGKTVILTCFNQSLAQSVQIDESKIQEVEIDGYGKVFLYPSENDQEADSVTYYWNYSKEVFLEKGNTAEDDREITE